MTPLQTLRHHVSGAIERGEAVAITGIRGHKKQFDPFPPVSGRYGAPMGRQGDNPANLQDAPRLHARRQGGDDGYDRGGAYWGYPSNVWGVWAHLGDEVACCYVRANSRADAIKQVREVTPC